MGNTGYNTGVSRWGTSFSSLRSTRHKRRLKNLQRGIPFVYFIQAENGMVKIGYARRPAQRWLTLQSSNPMELRLLLFVPGDSVTEERLHAAFERHRHSGEWFRPDTALMAFIADLKAAVDWTELPDPHRYCE